MTALLANTFEGGTGGTALSGANSGGASGSAFDTVTIGSGATLAFDSTRSVHGALSLKVATVAAAQSYAVWHASITGGPYAQFWYRAYLYFTANPANQHHVITTSNGTSNCGSVFVTAAGKITCTDTNGTVQLTSASTIPLNAWFRLEGFVVGSASAGQVGFSLFTIPDSGGLPAETQASGTALDTLGQVAEAMFGCQSSVASVGPFWLDDVAVSGTGPLGPSLGLAAAGPQVPQPRHVPGARARTGWLGLPAGGTAAPGPAPAPPGVTSVPLCRTSIGAGRLPGRAVTGPRRLGGAGHGGTPAAAPVAVAAPAQIPRPGAGHPPARARTGWQGRQSGGIRGAGNAAVTGRAAPPQQPPQPRHPAPGRARTGRRGMPGSGHAGPAPVPRVAAAYQRSPVLPRSPAPRRARAGGIRGRVNAAPVPVIASAAAVASVSAGDQASTSVTSIAAAATAVSGG